MEPLAASSASKASLHGPRYAGVVTLQARIERKLAAALTPQVMLVENESHMHSVKPGSETHFKVLVVSPEFDGASRVARQRRVNELLRDELSGGVHALTMRALTPAEYAEGGADGFVSPNCHGGSKAG
jgi:BolA protein